MSKPMPFADRESVLTPKKGYFVGTFFAMGCPCEVLVETGSTASAEQVLKCARDEAWRIEALWSRYLNSSIVETINSEPERRHLIDAETAALFEYAQKLWQLSAGKFDITSGVYRKIWSFDGGTIVPSREQIERIRCFVGWDKVSWAERHLKMLPGMEIDLGGVGKEYAVDACCKKISAFSDVSCLVNFGGDCATTKPPKTRPCWTLGIESVSHAGISSQNISLVSGGVATSGNVHRYVKHKGRRLSHVIDAKTGWPIKNAPQTVTVKSNSCMEAGSLATLACLQGADAGEFLADEAEHWIQP